MRNNLISTEWLGKKITVFRKSLTAQLFLFFLCLYNLFEFNYIKIKIALDFNIGN